MAQESQEGKVQLGGCVIMEDNPDTHCRACGHDWIAGRTGPPPEESCLACYRGATETCVAFEGDGEWIVANLMRAGGMTLEAAKNTYEAYLIENDPDHTLGKVPAGSQTIAVRLCPDCAAKAGLSVGAIGGDVPCYQEPAQFR